MDEEKPPPNDTGAKKGSNAKKSEEQKEKEQEQIGWAQALTLDSIVLTNDKTDVHTLGGKRWNDVKNGKKKIKGLSTRAKKAFLAKNNIQIRNEFRNVPLLGRNIAAYINEGPARRAITSGARKKSSSTAKPGCITEDGTLFRLSNVVGSHARGRGLFMQLRLPHDKEDLTGPGAKAVIHEGLWKIYKGDDGDGVDGATSLNVIQIDMSGYTLDRDCPQSFDDLSSDEFVQVLKWFQQQVKAVMHAKRRSGSHGSAATAAGNVMWKVYAVKLFESIGDKDFMSCIDPQLDPEVMRSSAPSTAKAYKGKQRGRRKRRSRSVDECDSDEEGFSLARAASSTKAKKHSAMEAAQDAAFAIAERNDECRRQLMTDRMHKQKRLALKYGEKKEKLKQILKSQKRKKKRRAPEYSSPKKHKVLKNFKEASKKEKCHQIEYERLKRELGYTSPEASSCSSSDEDAFSQDSL
ncbi:hypothetical protein THAOC_22174 [Thalassiosira oceanica]|uniref:Uncharacterized protein n=1 Tax=Thalassiosira oceanica TaxID=159749 RepID=K0RVD0_THAOC|nr:hypothetical protein THAOC_22174 [Thalassiosira oceanica]|eukprot:EJK57753.1 hypothetical protein THAOC_22174 [Thalassiosira oceanica]